jgi:AcrR family transcriptional regulator
MAEPATGAKDEHAVATGRPTGGRPGTGKRAAATRARLLEAAVQVIEREGYANATVDDIVSAAQTRRATFYLHFSSKREVVYEVLEGLRGTSYMVVDPPVHREVTLESVRRWFDDVAAYWHEHRARIAIVDNAAAHDREIRAVHENGRRTSIDLLTGWIRDAGSDADPRLRAMMLHSELRALLELTIVRGVVEWDEARALDLLAERWYAALRPARSA